MKRNKAPLSSVSKANSYEEIGEFWDTHDLADFWDQTRKADFEVDIGSERIYCSLDRDLAGKVYSVAKRRGVSTDTLINLWVQEKLLEQNL